MKLPFLAKLKLSLWHYVAIVGMFLGIVFLIFRRRSNVAAQLTKDLADARRRLAVRQARAVETHLERLQEKGEVLKEEEEEIERDLVRVREIAEKETERIHEADLVYLDQFFADRGL